MILGFSYFTTFMISLNRPKSCPIKSDLFPSKDFNNHSFQYVLTYQHVMSCGHHQLDFDTNNLIAKSMSFAYTSSMILTYFSEAEKLLFRLFIKFNNTFGLICSS